MKYWLNILPIIVGLSFFSGCDVNDTDNFQQLYQDFNGTWQPVHSISDHPIDADLDGETSRFLLEEIPNWDIAFLSLQILEDSDGDEYPHLLTLPYPDQHLPSESSLGDPDFYINYSSGLAGRSFKVTRTARQLSFQLQPISNYRESNPPHYKSIKSKNNHLILEVVMEIRLLTAEGWQTIEITTRYARIAAVT